MPRSPGRCNPQLTTVDSGSVRISAGVRSAVAATRYHGDMTAVHIRDVPEPTMNALRERARRHGHSMQQELRQILDAAAAAPEPARHLPPIELELVMVDRSAPGPVDSTWSREEIYGDDGR